MNTVGDLMYRLLKLYSVKTLRDFFEIEAPNQEVLISEIVRLSTRVAIQRFALNNIDTTKQHIYFYNLANRFNRNAFDFPNFPYPIFDEVATGNIYQFKFLPIIDHSVVILTPDVVQDNMEFLQPAVLTIQGTHMRLQFTILEKNMGAYVPQDQEVVKVEKAIDEEAIIDKIVFFLNDTNTVSICDINRGVKHMWERDLIDAKDLKYKKTHSTARENMDPPFTVKRVYPEVYESLINAPLHRTAFKYIVEDERICSHFTTDPTAGIISIPIFPSNANNVNQVENVISEIIQHN